MSPENEKILKEKYPVILENMGTPYYGSIDVGDGWSGIIDKLCLQLSETPEPIKATQIKEKFGTLRFYTDVSTDQQDKFITSAENESAIVCEVCGRPGKIRSSGRSWIKTLCDEHNN